MLYNPAMLPASFFLNGCVGSGKSTLANAIQQAAEFPLLHVSLDGFLKQQGPKRWNAFPDKRAVWDRMLDGFHASIEVLLRTGNHVVVDHVLQEKRWLPALAASLQAHNVYFVGVYCDAAVAQARLDARGVGDTETIAFQLARIHRHGVYDLEVQTDALPATELARQLLAYAAAEPPLAFAGIACGK